MCLEGTNTSSLEQLVLDRRMKGWHDVNMLRQSPILSAGEKSR
ncbi:hypothetical protein L798_04669 [Zootermopsis nevadensis]|uniref:Uncharacterized protein n=1 Tax=Zootermopsis nevadensis TaxID=136037 RepID=A0A067QSF0_ZOONE|nr:hypothetical protein L798_04669 [Zootermopsis nevadensis]